MKMMMAMTIIQLINFANMLENNYASKRQAMRKKDLNMNPMAC
jgi:hypothetical protein